MRHRLVTIVIFIDTASIFLTNVNILDAPESTLSVSNSCHYSETSIARWHSEDISRTEVDDTDTNKNGAPLECGMVIELSLFMSTLLAHETGNQTIEEQALQVSRIHERAQHETLALLQSLPSQKELVPVREWMSATQLAEYWQLYNDKNEPTTAGILKWSKRPSNQFPLPHVYIGDLLRFNRVEVDNWAKEEVQRRRVQNEKRRLKIA